MNTLGIVELSFLKNGMSLGKAAVGADNEAVFMVRELDGDMTLSKQQNGRKRGFLASQIVLLMLFLTYFPFADVQDRIYSQMDAMMLIPREEPYTALYFEYYDDLPTKVAANETVDFSFTIKNEEGVDREYSYDVYFNNGENRKRISVGKGTVFIRDGEKMTITELYDFTQDHDKEILYVELDTGQKIHFILTGEQK